MFKITTLMDNLPSEHKALHADHGLSYFIESDDQAFLFDCGSGENTIHNARMLGTDLNRVNFTILSHNHYDHAAGYRNIVNQGYGGTTLYTGQSFFREKYACNGPKYTQLSSGITKDFINERNINHKECGDLLKILPGVWLLGNFPRVNEFETIPSRFVVGNLSNPQPDLFEDEICLALETSKGIVMIVGCSHPGILNMAMTVHRRLEQPIYALFGGTHLNETEAPQIQKIISALKEMGISLFGLSHCSGTLSEEIVSHDEAITGCHLAVGDNILLS